MSPSMNAPVRASMRTSSLVAGDGHGCGVTVIGPQEGNPNDPDSRTAQTGVAASTMGPPSGSAPNVESVVETTVTGIVEDTWPIAVDAAA
jgi:hypothetical protein